MGVITFSIPKELVKRIVKEVKFDNFIETGTFQGGTCFWAAGQFKNVFTIEIDPVMSKTTASKPDCPKNIAFLVGNSKDVLPKLVAEKLSGRSFFWLDGHWCGGGGKDEECPLILELEAIRDLKTSVIFIDDARCFLGPLPKPHEASHWPRIDEIFAKLKELFPENMTTIQDDVIMSVPPDVAEIINADWQEKYFTRFPVSEPVMSKKELLRKLLFSK